MTSAVGADRLHVTNACRASATMARALMTALRRLKSHQEPPGICPFGTPPTNGTAILPQRVTLRCDDGQTAWSIPASDSPEPSLVRARKAPLFLGVQPLTLRHRHTLVDMGRRSGCRRATCGHTS